MNQQPSVLVMMSTYNGERYLRDQIDSILIQEDVDVTLFVRDDGSRDQTTSILDAYQAEGKLRWYTGKNLGAAYSFWNLVENGEKQLPNFEKYLVFKKRMKRKTEIYILIMQLMPRY